MTNPRQLTGVLPIVHTPFTDGDAIDEASLRRQLDWAFDTGADGCGTGMVSEILRLTTAERTRLSSRKSSTAVAPSSPASARRALKNSLLNPVRPSWGHSAPFWKFAFSGNG